MIKRIIVRIIVCVWQMKLVRAEMSFRSCKLVKCYNISGKSLSLGIRYLYLVIPFHPYFTLSMFMSINSGGTSFILSLSGPDYGSPKGLLGLMISSGTFGSPQAYIRA